MITTCAQGYYIFDYSAKTFLYYYRSLRPQDQDDLKHKLIKKYQDSISPQTRTELKDELRLIKKEALAWQ